MVVVVAVILLSLSLIGCMVAPYATLVSLCWLGFWVTVVHWLASRYGGVHSRTAMVSDTDDRETPHDITPIIHSVHSQRADGM